MDTVHALLADLTDSDDERAEAAARALPAYGQEAVAALRELATDPQADRRWWAVRALAEIPDPGVPALLRKALGDPDASVRQCAALACHRHPDPASIPPLIGALSDGDRLCASLAADALAGMGGDAVPALLEALESGPQAARLEAVRALALIADKRAIPALMGAFQEGSALMEYWANEGLERMGLGLVYLEP